MSLNPHTVTTSRNLGLDAAFDVAGSGFLDFYDGTQPANANTAVSTQVKAAHLPLASTAFSPAASGSKAAGTITSAIAIASTTVTWARLTKSDGTAVQDFSVGTSGCDINFDSATWINGVTNVTMSSLTMSQAG